MITRRLFTRRTRSTISEAACAVLMLAWLMLVLFALPGLAHWVAGWAP